MTNFGLWNRFPCQENCVVCLRYNPEITVFGLMCILICRSQLFFVQTFLQFMSVSWHPMFPLKLPECFSSKERVSRCTLFRRGFCFAFTGCWVQIGSHGNDHNLCSDTIFWSVSLEQFQNQRTHRAPRVDQIVRILLSAPLHAFWRTLGSFETTTGIKVNVSQPALPRPGSWPFPLTS